MAPKKWFEVKHLKTIRMLIHSSRNVTGNILELSVEGNQVEQVRSFKYLEVTINDTLTWSNHINTVCTKVSCNINLLRRLSWFLPQPLLLLFLKSYILPLFDYCGVVWTGCTKSEASRLETLHNYACRTVLCQRKGSSASTAHRKLSLPTLASRRTFTSLSPCSTVCLPSPVLIYLSFYLHLHPTTTPAPLRLPNSTFHLIVPPLAKSHSLS